MDSHRLTVYKVELKSQLELAAIAADDLETARQNKAPGTLWYALQGILMIAGNVSKLLWGSSGTEEQRKAREPLRKASGVADDSPLRPRKVRNAFEHFDERIEEWYEVGDIATFVSRSVGSGTNEVIRGHGVPHAFGNYNPRNGIVRFWDHEVSIPDLVTEMDAIWDRLWPDEKRRLRPPAPGP